MKSIIMENVSLEIYLLFVTVILIYEVFFLIYPDLWFFARIFCVSPFNDQLILSFRVALNPFYCFSETYIHPLSRFINRTLRDPVTNWRFLSKLTDFREEKDSWKRSMLEKKMLNVFRWCYIHKNTFSLLNAEPPVDIICFNVYQNTQNTRTTLLHEDFIKY